MSSLLHFARPAGNLAALAAYRRPVANARLYLDPYRQPVPVGVRVNCISAARFRPGYLERPDLTAEKFIPDPYSRISGARLYCTGDSARYSPDGNIEFMDVWTIRSKWRGFRVELGD